MLIGFYDKEKNDGEKVLLREAFKWLFSFHQWKGPYQKAQL